MKSTAEIDAALRARLHEAVNRFTAGNTDAFGRLLGYMNGGYVREMLVGNKPVRRAIIERANANPELAGWFDDFLPKPVQPVQVLPADALRIAETFAKLPVESVAPADSRHQLYIDIMAMLTARLAAGPTTARAPQPRKPTK